MKEALTFSTLFHSLALAFFLGFLSFKSRPVQTYIVDLSIGSFGVTEGGNAGDEEAWTVPDIPADVITPEESKDFLRTRSTEKPIKPPPKQAANRSQKIAPADKISSGADGPRGDGRARGNGGSGQANLGIGSGMSNFPYPAYMEAVRRKIAMQWQAGFWRDNRLERKAQAVFTIRRDGSVAGAEIQDRSGDSNFDLSCLRGISQAAPFPPLPEGLPDQVRIIFDFEIAY